jgi:hypothetical protein
MKFRATHLIYVLALFAILAAVVAVIFFGPPITQHARYERAKKVFGGQRMTRSQAMDQIDNRDADLLPDSEFLPEWKYEKSNSPTAHQ